MPPTQAPASVETLLGRMVAFDTVNAAVSGRVFPEAPLTAYLESLAQTWGFETRRLPVPGGGENLYVLHRVTADRPWLMFESHLDTVSIEGMTIPPLAGEIRDGRLWARGACDTKGTGAAMLWALRRYAEGQERPQNIALAFTVDEECGMTGVRALAGTHLAALSIRPRGVIVGEPTRCRPIHTHNGVVRWRVVTKGVAAHSADPSKGRSAIAAMMKVIEALETRYIARLAAEDAETGRARCSINLIRGGSQINIIPAECEVHIDRRLVPGEDGTGVLPATQALLEELRAGDPTIETSQDLLFAAPPLTTRHNGGLTATVQRALRGLGLEPAAAGVAYATDAGDLDAAGIPAVVLGPGDIAQAHTKDEYLDLDELRRGVEVYLALMRA